MKNWKKIVFSAIFIIAVILPGILWYHRVDNRLTEEDKQYIPMFLTGISTLSDERTFEEEIEFINEVQDSVLTVAPINKGIPFKQAREPKDLYEANLGLCFDRSRVIEKILQHENFQTRHIFIYSITETNSTIQSLFKRETASHAVTEVLTKKGWLVVDSNERWISLDAEDEPHSIQDLRLSAENKETINWKNNAPAIYSDIAPFNFVYGLYSRHGNFYPPYDFVPDVNYGELLDNVF